MVFAAALIHVAKYYSFGTAKAKVKSGGNQKLVWVVEQLMRPAS